MNIFKTLCLLLLLCGTVPSFAQTENNDKRKEKIAFSSINTAGVVIGGDVPELQLQSVNGVRNETWFAGLGAGIDYYYLRSITAFMDVRRQLFQNRLPLYVYGDVGMNLPWASERDKNPWMRSNFGNGLYYDAGLGYRFKIKGESAVVLNAGYSVKEYKEDRISTGMCIWAPCPEFKEQYSYRLRRIAIKAGFQF